MSLTGALHSKKSNKAQVAAMEAFMAAAEQDLLPSSQLIPHILRWHMPPPCLWIHPSWNPAMPPKPNPVTNSFTILPDKLGLLSAQKGW